nr:isochorismatase family protein [Paenibacillus terrae]
MITDWFTEVLIFVGCNFPNCPRTSIYQASERDFKVVMVEDAVSRVYRKGLDEIMNIGVTVYATNQFMQKLEGSPRNSNLRKAQ